MKQFRYLQHKLGTAQIIYYDEIVDIAEELIDPNCELTQALFKVYEIPDEMMARIMDPKYSAIILNDLNKSIGIALKAALVSGRRNRDLPLEKAVYDYNQTFPNYKIDFSNMLPGKVKQILELGQGKISLTDIIDLDLVLVPTATFKFKFHCSIKEASNLLDQILTLFKLPYSRSVTEITTLDHHTYKFGLEIYKDINQMLISGVDIGFNFEDHLFSTRQSCIHFFNNFAKYDDKLISELSKNHNSFNNKEMAKLILGQQNEIANLESFEHHLLTPKIEDIWNFGHRNLAQKFFGEYYEEFIKCYYLNDDSVRAMELWELRADHFNLIISDIKLKLEGPLLRLADDQIEPDLNYELKYETLKDCLKFLPDDLNKYICDCWLRVEIESF
jgi:hypothetical protein